MGVHRLYNIRPLIIPGNTDGIRILHPLEADGIYLFAADAILIYVLDVYMAA